ncbi:prenyltransferase [Rosistilla ulvae]|uniref:Prenyltransferase n=1 Tax=Rosistilla ulvae TaxID=1930277 RepID=A0A517LYP6_9BACT|nr:UbiA family prenyltransferase [Rosistilla ulvae]QDS87719.1 prenyltransferase [Rosistilla ulvae]
MTVGRLSSRPYYRKRTQDMLEIIKIARPGFWPTHVWFYLLPFAGRDMLGSIPFWLGCFYVSFPLGLLLYGWNDLGDYVSDLCNPRKDSWLFGGRPDASMRQRLPWIIAAVQVPFVIAFVIIGGSWMLLWFAAVLMTNATYNTFGFKRLPVLDLLNQIGYLLIFLLGSWLCGVPQLNAATMVFSALFAMQSHLFGQLMDIEEDRIAQRHNTAITIGAVPSKWLLVGIMLIEVAISWTYFHSPIVAGFMFAGALFFSLDAIAGPKQYPPLFTKFFFIAWNLIVIATMHFVWRYGVFLVD